MDEEYRCEAGCTHKETYNIRSLYVLELRDEESPDHGSHSLYREEHSYPVTCSLIAF